MENWQNWLRLETNGVLGAEQNLDTLLGSLGYSGNLAMFMDATGKVHLLVAGTRNSVAGLYYLLLP
jgi:hypothetical protein